MSWRLNHPSTLVSRWPLQNAVGVITPDTQGRYPGTMVNAPTWGVGPKNSLQCIELDGNTQHVNLGDVTQLNAVSAFTLCFWMNQDVLDQSDELFAKTVDATHRIRFTTNVAGAMIFRVADGVDAYGVFDYSTVISALSWAHVAVIYDGTQTGNSSRLVVYLNGAPITLTFTGTIPIATANLSGQDATIGATANSFDGRFWDERLYSVPLSRDEVNKIIHGPVPVV